MRKKTEKIEVNKAHISAALAMYLKTYYKDKVIDYVDIDVPEVMEVVLTFADYSQQEESILNAA
jgi:hypothetical protein